MKDFLYLATENRQMGLCPKITSKIFLDIIGQNEVAWFIKGIFLTLLVAFFPFFQRFLSFPPQKKPIRLGMLLREVKHYAIIDFRPIPKGIYGSLNAY